MLWHFPDKTVIQLTLLGLGLICPINWGFLIHICWFLNVKRKGKKRSVPTFTTLNGKSMFKICLNGSVIIHQEQPTESIQSRLPGSYCILNSLIFHFCLWEENRKSCTVSWTWRPSLGSTKIHTSKLCFANVMLQTWGIIKLCTGWKRGGFCTLLTVCFIQFTLKIYRILNSR